MAFLNSIKCCVAGKIVCSNFFGCPLGYHGTFRFYDLVNMKINKNRLLLALLPVLLAGCTTPGTHLSTGNKNVIQPSEEQQESEPSKVRLGTTLRIFQDSLFPPATRQNCRRVWRGSSSSHQQEQTTST